MVQFICKLFIKPSTCRLFLRRNSSENSRSNLNFQCTKTFVLFRGNCEKTGKISPVRFWFCKIWNILSRALKEDDVNMWLIPYSHYVVSIFDLNNSILLGNNILKITIFLKTPFPKLLLPKAVFLDSSAQQGRDNHSTFSLIVIIRYRNSSCTWDYTSSSLLSLTFSNPCPITRSIPSHSSSSTKLHRLPLKSLVSQNGHRSQ